MTKSACIFAAQQAANDSQLDIVVVNDPFSEDDDPYDFCPACAVRDDGKLTLFPHATIELTIKPA